MTENDKVTVSNYKFATQLSHMIKYNVSSVVCNGLSDNAKIIELFEDFSDEYELPSLDAHEHMYFEGLFAAMVHDRDAMFYYSLYAIEKWTERVKSSNNGDYPSPTGIAMLSVDKIAYDFMRECFLSIFAQTSRDNFVSLKNISLQEALYLLEFDNRLFADVEENVWSNEGVDHGWVFKDVNGELYVINSKRDDVRSLDDALAVLRIAVTEAVGNLHYRDKMISDNIYTLECTLSDIAAKRHNYFWDNVLHHVYCCGIELHKTYYDYSVMPDNMKSVHVSRVAVNESYNLYYNF